MASKRKTTPRRLQPLKAFAVAALCTRCATGFPVLNHLRCLQQSNGSASRAGRCPAPRLQVCMTVGDVGSSTPPGSSTVPATAAGSREETRLHALAAPTMGGTQSLDPMPAAATKPGRPSAQTMKVAAFFFLWYCFNVGYNLSTKRALTMIAIPWSLAVAQLLAGIPYVLFLWASGLRKAPRLRLADVKVVAPVALLHTCAHLTAVVSIGAGAMGFVQIVKACEPLFTAAFSAIFMGVVLPLPVYLTLLPVVSGVALASAKELSFGATALIAAMCSNTCAAGRSVFGKLAFAKAKGENMDAGNTYAVMTIIGSVVLAPFAVLLEGRRLPGLWRASVVAGFDSGTMARCILLSGLFFYLYNEVAFYCLNEIHPITHAVGNTLKRVVMIAVSILVLNDRFTLLGASGAALSIAGVLSYIFVKARCDADVARRRSSGLPDKKTL